MFGIGLSVALWEMKNINTGLSSTNRSVLVYNICCSMGLALSIYIRYDINMKWNISRGVLTEYDNLRTSGRLKSFLIEVLINIMAPYPYLDKIKYIEHNEQFNAYLEYDLNDLLLFFSFVRIYLLIRYALVMS
jgi:hypothetical protein